MMRTAIARGSGLLRSAQAPIAERGSLTRRLFASDVPKDGQVPPPEEEIPDPPGMFATIGAMGAGAGGAVFIAAVGVWAVFKMAFWVAGETGRSMKAEESAAVAAAAAAAAAGGDSSGASPRIPSPLEPPAAQAARLLAG